ncbi:MAG: hypothetical protein U0X91_04950 [Spirosomataceae bacterium]
MPAKLKTVRERQSKEFISKINAMLLEGYVIDQSEQLETIALVVAVKLAETLSALLKVKNFELKSKSAYKIHNSLQLTLISGICLCVLPFLSNGHPLKKQGGFIKAALLAHGILSHLFEFNHF